MVYCVPPFSGHLQPSSPPILAWIIAGLLRDEVAVVDNDRDLGQLRKLCQGHADARERPTGTWQRLRDFTFRKQEATARLIRHDCSHIGGLEDGHPSESAP